GIGQGLLRGGERLPGVTLQRPEMRPDRREQRGLVVVREAVLLGDFAHDRRQRRIVHAADLGEQMVLDLMVQPTHVPRDQRVAVGEIGRRASSCATHTSGMEPSCAGSGCAVSSTTWASWNTTPRIRPAVRVIATK